jgi:hypothetical protein
LIDITQDEILRAIDAIQLGDKHRIATPVNWKQGEDVIIHASVNNEEAKTLFPAHKAHLVGLLSCAADQIVEDQCRYFFQPYLRTTPI